MNLYQMTAEYETVFLQLCDMADDLPDDAVADTIEAIEGELMAKGANVAAFVMNLAAEAEKCKAAEQRIAKRRKALESREKRLREYLRQNMERAWIKSITAIDGSFKATLTAPRDSVVIDEDAAIPDKYCRFKREPEKAEILKAIKSGEYVPGARIESKHGLRIQ